MQEKINLLVKFLSIAIILSLVSCERHETPYVIKSEPKYNDKKYIDLAKQFTIDVTQINLFTKRNDYRGCYDFDSKNNLYILDTFEGLITAFDEKGNLIRQFGGRGQGPNEFINANFMVIKKDKIYIFQGQFELKILNLQGKLIKKDTIQIIFDNPLGLKAVGDKFYLIKGKTDRTFTHLELILSEVGENFSGGKELWRYKYSYGLNGYPCWEWLLILNSGEYFFPEDNHSEYIITKYNKAGNPELKFGRKYNMKKYSKEAMKRFYSIHKKAIERGRRKVFQEPPIVRRMFQDSKKNIWVVSGETYEDNLNPDFKNTIDLFNNKGEWIYSFKSAKISKNIFYNNGKIYKVLPLDEYYYSQFIEVYEIKYLLD